MNIKPLAAFAVGVASAPLTYATGCFLAERCDRGIDFVREVRRRKVTFHDDESRANAAAQIMYAPRFHAVRMPWGMSFAWRSLTPSRPEVHDFASEIRHAYRSDEPLRSTPEVGKGHR